MIVSNLILHNSPFRGLIQITPKWRYLYRVVDSDGSTLDLLLTAKRDFGAAKRFFRKMLKAIHTQTPRAITVDKNTTYQKP